MAAAVLTAALALAAHGSAGLWSPWAPLRTLALPTRLRMCVRSLRPPIEPMAINAIVAAWKRADGDVDAVVREALERRAFDGDARLDEEDRSLLTTWISGVLVDQAALQAALAALAAREPFYDDAELGVGHDDNPYVVLCRAECMLALWLLHRAPEDVRRPVQFIDADRLGLLEACIVDGVEG